MYRYLTYLIFLAVLVWGGCNTHQDTATEEKFGIENDTDDSLRDAIIEISRNKFKTHTLPEDSIAVYDPGSNTPLITQLVDTSGDGNWDLLYFVTDIHPKEEKEFLLSWNENQRVQEDYTNIRFGKRDAADTPVYEARSDTFYANQVPYRENGFEKYQTDGPSWENDKVGFRIYLDGRNAIDIFGKKNAAITPKNVGLDSSRNVVVNYQRMQPWGKDIYAVGNSLGLGGISLEKKNGNLLRLGIIDGDTVNNVKLTTFHILAKRAPIRSQFQLKFLDWPMENESNYSVNWKIGITRGLYGFDNEVKVSGLEGGEKLLIGLANIDTDKPLNVKEIGDWVVLYLHDKQTVDHDSGLGLALVLPKEKYSDNFLITQTRQGIGQSYLARLNVKNGEVLKYYALACWEGRDAGFKDEAYFESYLTKFVKRIDFLKNLKTTVY